MQRIGGKVGSVSRKSLRILAGIGLLCASLPMVARAADGQLEINHACATTTGCFAGDAPGYPVTITAAGSYRLTSNLTVPAGTNGVEVATGVDLDLAGFEIAGPVSCLEGCPAPGAGTGIVSGTAGGSQCAVANGKVRGFGLDGIRLSLQAHVENVRVTDVARYGINLGGGSLAEGNLLNRIGQNGIVFGTSVLVRPSLYERNTVHNVGGTSVVGGRASGPNVCADRLCGTTGRKLFYLTPGDLMGSEALTACAAGYHMASFYEIHDLGAIEYDTRLGVTKDDSGDGPPNDARGWIRTGGSASNAAGDPGIPNCSAWTSDTGQGTWAYLSRSMLGNTNGAATHPWTVVTDGCGATITQTTGVWCIQD